MFHLDVLEAVIIKVYSPVLWYATERICHGVILIVREFWFASPSLFVLVLDVGFG